MCQLSYTSSIVHVAIDDLGIALIRVVLQDIQAGCLVGLGKALSDGNHTTANLSASCSQGVCEGLLSSIPILLKCVENALNPPDLALAQARSQELEALLPEGLV